MSDSQTVWMILWRRALRSDNPRDPFEISEVVPDVVEALKVPERDAARLVSGLLNELERLPEGEQYFRQEGNAVVPLPEFANVHQDPDSELKAYPYEL
ncbi:MAG TPA: hypothetical protein VKP69_08235 [Isosphaeraceae bacterium]|nr:hypothetical protein [Isosphaeraceae bacterium]